jgi:hypothetical protein
MWDDYCFGVAAPSSKLLLSEVSASGTAISVSASVATPVTSSSKGASASTIWPITSPFEETIVVSLVQALICSESILGFHRYHVLDNLYDIVVVFIQAIDPIEKHISPLLDPLCWSTLVILS